MSVLDVDSPNDHKPPRRGRPTKLNAALTEQIADEVRYGAAPETAARANGISPRTYWRWMQQGQDAESDLHVDFRQSLEMARAAAKMSAEKRLYAGAARKPTLVWLSRNWPDEWGRNVEMRGGAKR